MAWRPHSYSNEEAEALRLGWRVLIYMILLTAAGLLILFGRGHS